MVPVLAGIIIAAWLVKPDAAELHQNLPEVLER